jgi:hypothetical protein
VTKPNILIVLATDPKRDGGAEILVGEDGNARITVSPAQMRDLMEQCSDDERRLDFILEAWVDMAELLAKGIDLDALCRRSSRLRRYRVIVVIVDPDDARGVNVRTDGDGNMHVFIGRVFMEEVEKAAKIAGKPLVEEVVDLAMVVRRVQVRRAMQEARPHQQTKKLTRVH